MRKDYVKAVSEVKRVLSQFTWVSLDGTMMGKIAQMNSYLIAKGLILEYQDTAIAASCLVMNSNELLTKNKKHFLKLPDLKDKVLPPAKLRDELPIKR